MNDTEKREILIKNLEYVSNTYNTTEQIFPIWEAAFSLIVGQLIIAYFGKICDDQRTLIAYIGCILSFIWFILVSLNLQHANSMNVTLKRLECMLNRELNPYRTDHHCPPYREFISAIPKTRGWTLENIIIGKKENESRIDAIKNIPRSTWAYRRALPLFLLVFWIYEVGLLNAIVSLFR